MNAQVVPPSASAGFATGPCTSTASEAFSPGRTGTTDGPLSPSCGAYSNGASASTRKASRICAVSGLKAGRVFPSAKNVTSARGSDAQERVPPASKVQAFAPGASVGVAGAATRANAVPDSAYFVHAPSSNSAYSPDLSANGTTNFSPFTETAVPSTVDGAISHADTSPISTDADLPAGMSFRYAENEAMCPVATLLR